MKDGQLLIANRRVAAVGGSSAVALAVLAGFVASVAMVFAFGVAFAVSLVMGRLPLPVLGTWFRGLTNNTLIDLAGPNLYAATAVFIGGGLLWALLYALVFEPRMGGRGWQRGMKFALIPWLFSLIVVLPLVGGGFLGFGLGAGPLPILGNLILHAAYGAMLGAIYSTADSVFDRPSHLAIDEELRAGHLSQVGAARGLCLGLIVGVIAGLGAALLVQFGDGFNPLAIAVAVTLTGAAFGGFIGSFASRT